MKLKIRKLQISIINLLLLGILVLNWLSIYIDSLMPRLVSYVLIIGIIIWYYVKKRTTSISIEKKKGLRIGYISICFLLPSMLALLLGNRYVFTTDGMYQILQPFLFMLLGYIWASRTNFTQRRRFYLIVWIILLFTVIYCFTSGNITYDYRYYSAFTNAILCGFYFMICFHMTNYFIKNIYAKVTVLLIISYAIILTQSRSAWIALVISFLLNYIGNRHEKLNKQRLITYISFIFAVLLLYLLYSEKISRIISAAEEIILSRFEGFQTHGSTTQRLGVIYYVFTKTNPILLIIGHGVGGLKQLLQRVTIVISGFNSSDNTYLTIIYDYGILGFLCICRLINLLWDSLLDKNSEEIRLLSMILISICIGAFFFEVLGWASLASVTLSFIGALYRLRLEKN